MIKIILVEDNAIVRKTVANLLGTQQDMKVVGEAANGREALELLQSGLEPNIILTDLNMPEMDGIEMTQRINLLALPDTKVIILTMHDKQLFVDKALNAGAKGYLLKNGDLDELYHAIRQVNQYDRFISSAISLRV